jgi:hypothetical protein
MFERLFYRNGLVNVFLGSSVPLPSLWEALTKTLSQLIRNRLSDCGMVMTEIPPDPEA